MRCDSYLKLNRQLISYHFFVAYIHISFLTILLDTRKTISRMLQFYFFLGKQLGLNITCKQSKSGFVTTVGQPALLDRTRISPASRPAMQATKIRMWIKFLFIIFIGQLPLTTVEFLTIHGSCYSTLSALSRSFSLIPLLYFYVSHHFKSAFDQLQLRT